MDKSIEKTLVELHKINGKESDSKVELEKSFEELLKRLDKLLSKNSFLEDREKDWNATCVYCLGINIHEDECELILLDEAYKEFKKDKSFRELCTILEREINGNLARKLQ